jgi:hypothetical protein
VKRRDLIIFAGSLAIGLPGTARNFKTAKVLGLTVQSLLARADEVIE